MSKPTTNHNQDICDMLIKLGEHERDVNGVIYKYHAYRKAARALEMYDKRVKSGAEAQKLSGIGPKIAQKIENFLQGEDGDNTVEKSHDDLKAESKTASPKSKSKRSKSETIPPKQEKIDLGQFSIMEHYDKFYGMTKIDALKMQIDGIRTISDLKSQKSLLTKAQIVCLEHFDDLCGKISRDEMKKFHKIVRHAVKKLKNDNVSVEMTGAFRRRAQESDSVDILIVDSSIETATDLDVAQKSLKKTLKKVVTVLVDEEIFVEHIALEFQGSRIVGLARSEKDGPCRRISLHCVAQDQFPNILFHSTGTPAFVQKIVDHALDNGFVLDQNSLRKIGLTGVIGLPIKLQDESELFQYIDHADVDPKHRNM